MGDPEHLWNQLGTGYTMDGFRKDVAKAMGTTTTTQVSTSTSTSTNTTLYRVRKSWSDTKSQIGAYAVLDNAKKACKDGYFVFDGNGNVVYPCSKKSITEIAKEVIDGKWSNGSERKKRLTAAGYSYDEVQAEVNRLLR